MPRRKTFEIPNGRCAICGASTYYKKTLCQKHESDYYNEKNRRPTTSLPHFVIKQREILQTS